MGIEAKPVGKEFFEELEKKGISLDDDMRRKLNEKLEKTINYTPVIGVLGKTGAGKSSFCNALFGAEFTEVSHDGAGTRDETPVIVDLGNGRKLDLRDMPGLGESAKYDADYKERYRTLIPKLDCVLWVIAADDRALAADEAAWQEVIQPAITQHKVPLVFISSKAERFEPEEDWNETAKSPGSKQQKAIEFKERLLKTTFPGSAQCPHRAVSSRRHYGFPELVEVVLDCLPASKRYAFHESTRPENRSPKSEEKAKVGLIETVVDWVVSATKQTAELVVKTVVTVFAEKLLSKLFGR